VHVLLPQTYIAHEDSAGLSLTLRSSVVFQYFSLFWSALGTRQALRTLLYMPAQLLDSHRLGVSFELTTSTGY
jgi:hypothetical protein